MERRITEEQLTKLIINWLESNDWEIISFDFPQSGTGISLHPNENIRTSKNKASIIPDIVAIKNKTVIFFENKDRFVITDFVKTEYLKQTSDYSISISKLLQKFTYSAIYYGIGIPYNERNKKNIDDNLLKIDFSILVNPDYTISVHFDRMKIFK